MARGRLRAIGGRRPSLLPADPFIMVRGGSTGRLRSRAAAPPAAAARPRLPTTRIYAGCRAFAICVQRSVSQLACVCMCLRACACVYVYICPPCVISSDGRLARVAATFSARSLPPSR